MFVVALQIYQSTKGESGAFVPAEERLESDIEQTRPARNIEVIEMEFIAKRARRYFWRGARRSSPAVTSFPANLLRTASINVRAALRTSSWIAVSASSSAWLVA